MFQTGNPSSRTNNRYNPNRRRIAVAAVAGMMLVSQQNLPAANTVYTYQGGGTTASPTSANWNLPASWGGTTPVSGTNAQLNFGGTSTTAFTATDDIGAGTFQLNQLNLSSAAAITLAPAVPANSLTFVTSTDALLPSIITNGTGTLTINNNLILSNTLSLSGTSTATSLLTGVISGAGGLTKTSFNTITLTGANTYTGLTTVSRGTLLLDFSIAGAPTTGGIINNTAVANGTGSALALSGGTLSLKGASAATNTQFFNSTAVNAGGSTITLTQNTATALTASLGAITRAAGGTLNFSIAPAATGVIATTTTANDATGILGTWATVGSGTTLQYAANNGSNQIVSYAGATADAGNLASLTSATTNYSYSAAATTAGSVTANTLRYTGAATTTNIGANLLTLNGLMNAGSNTLTISGTGKVVIGGTEMVITGNTQSTIISAPIANTGSTTTTNGTTASGLTYSGLGTLTLSGTNTFTGATRVVSGVLQEMDAATVTSLTTSSGISVFNGATLALFRTNNSTGITQTVSNPATTLNDGATLRVGSSNGTVTFAFANAFAINGNTTINLTGGSFGLAITSSGALTGTGTINLTAGGTGGSNTRQTTMSGTGTGYSGNWIVSGPNSAPYLNTLTSGATGALGTGTVTLGNFSLLNTTTSTGLNSLTGIVLNSTTANLTAPVGMSSAGTLTIAAGTANVGTNAATLGAITLGSIVQSGGSLRLDVAAATNDKVTLTGNYTYTGGTIDVPVSAVPTTIGTPIDLVVYGGLRLGTPTVNVTGLTNTRFSSVVDLGTGVNSKITVSFTGAVANLIWTGSTSSAWDLNTTANFLNGVTADKFFNYDNVTFDETGASAANPTLAVSLTPSSVTFNNTLTPYTLTGAGAIAGTTGLVKNGAALVTLGTPNTFTGAVNINAGTLSVGTVAASGTASNLGAGASVTLGDPTNTGTLQYTGATATTNKTFGVNAGGGRIDVTDSAAVLTASGVFSGSGSFTKLGTGTLLLSGANTLSGPITVSAGTLRAGNAAALGTAVGTTDGTTIASGATLDINAINLGSEQVTIGGTGVGAAGAVVNSGAQQTQALRFLSLSADATIGGTGRWDVRGTGSLVNLNGFKLTKTATNYVAFVTSTVGNGDIDVNAGTLAFALGYSVGGTGTLSVNTGGTLSLGDFGVASTLTKNITLAGGTVTTDSATTSGNSTVASAINLATGTTSTITAQTGSTLVLNGGISGPGSVVLTNAGAVVLSTVAGNAIGGTVTNNGATLTLAGAGTAGTFTVTGGLSLNGGTLNYDLSSNAVSGNDQIILGGPLSLAGLTTINITPAITGLAPNSTYTLITGGTSVTGSAANLALSGLSASGSTRQTFALDTTTTPGSVLLNITGAKASLVWTGTTDNNWDLVTTAGNFTGAVDNRFYNLDDVTFDDSATGPNLAPIVTGTLLPSSVTFNNSTNTYALAGTGTIGGSGSLIKSGTGIASISTTLAYTGTTTVNAGTLVLTGTNTLSGPMNVVGGTLQVGDGGTVGTLGTSSVTVGTGANLVFNRTDATSITVVNNLSGTGTVTFKGSGASGISSYTITGSSAGLTGTVVADSARVQVTNTATASRLGTAALTMSGSGQYYLVGGTYANNFTVSGTGWLEANGNLGAIRLDSGAIINGDVTMSGDTRLTAYASSGTINGAIKETAGGPKNLELGTAGTVGTITLAGLNTYTGSTSINNQNVFIGTGTQTTNLLASTSSITIGGAAASGAGALTYRLGGDATFNTPVTFTGAGTVSTFVVNNTATANTLTVSSSQFGTTTANGKLEVLSGTLTLASGFNGQVNYVDLKSTPANSTTPLIGTLNVQPGASLTTTTLYVGDASNMTGIVNQTGGTVAVTGGGTTMRIGHWANGVSPVATYNISGGNFDVSAGQLSVGWDGGGTLNVSGTTTLVKALTLYVDANGATTTAGNLSTVNLSGGTIQVGTGGIPTLGGGTLNVSGGTLQGVGSGTWATPMVTTAATTTSLSVDPTFTVVQSGAISGSGNLTKVGGGTLTISNANAAYTGNVTISAGTLQLGNAGTTGDIGPNPIVNNGTLAINKSTATSFVSAMSGTGGLTKLGTNVLTLPNTTGYSYTGPTLVSAGTLNLTGQLGQTAVTIADGASLNGKGVIGAPAGVGASLTLGGTTGATLIADATVAGALTVNGDVTANGVNTLSIIPGSLLTAGSPYTFLNYTGTFTGSTANFALANAANSRPATFTINPTNVTVTLSSAALKWSGATSLAWDLNTTANFVDSVPSPQNFFAGDSVTFDDSATAAKSTVALAGALSPSSITVNNTTAVPYIFNNGASGSITGGGTLTKIGNGVLTVNLANTYTGGTTISAGEVRVSVAGALGTGTITLGNAATGANNTSIYLDAARTNFATPIVISNNGTGTMTLGSRSTVTGTGANNSFANITLQRDVIFDSNANDRTDYGNITGTGNITIVGTGRTIFLTNGTNTFLGDITVATSGANGSFQFGTATGGSTNYIPDTSSVTVNSGAVFRPSSGAETINGLSGAGSISPNSINHTLTIGASNGNGNYSGTLANGGASVLTLIKNGTGTQIFSGTNTYSGNTTVNAGTLLAAKPGSLPGYNIVTRVAAAAGATVAVRAGGVGEWAAADIDALQTGTTFATGSFLGFDVLSGNTFTYANDITGTKGMSKSSPGTLVLAGAKTYTGPTAVNGGTLLATSPAALPGYNTPGKVTVAAGATLSVQAGGTGDWASADISTLQSSATFAATSFLGVDVLTGNTFTYAGSITGTKGLLKTSSGMLTLTGTSTHSGGTTVAGGTLDASAGSLAGTGPITVTGTGSQLIAKTITPSTLTVGAGATVTLTNVDTVASVAGRSTVGTWDNSGLVDIGKTGVVIANATEVVIQGQILAARGTGATGTWTGTTGITSSNAAANPGSRGIGYVVSGLQITVAQTVLGDANLDDIVNIDDLSILAQNYNLSSTNWQRGDYNYDTIVNIDDLSILAQNYNLTATDSPLTPPAGASAAFAADFAAVFSGSAVPEPGTVSLLALAGVGLLARRRRKAK